MKLKPYPKYKDSGIEWIGEIPEGWGVRRLKHVVNEFIAGGTPSSDNEKFWSQNENEGIPWVTIGDMTDHDFIEETKKKITIEGLADKRLRILKKGTLVYSIFASLGKVSVLSIDSTTNQAILGLVPSKRIHTNFLKYYLRFIEEPIIILSNANTQNNLNSSIVKNINISIPKIEEQTAIASFLDKKTSQLNKLIEKNQKLIELLKEKRTALINHAVTKGLDPNAKMKNSGVDWIGEIPEGWEVRKLKYICTKYAEYGLNIASDNYQTDGIRFIRTTDIDEYGNLKDGGIYINNSLSKGYTLKNGDLLISRSGTIGRTFLFDSEKNEKATYAGYLVRFSIDKNKAIPKYIFYFTKTNSFFAWLEIQSIETTIENVNGQKYANLLITIPPLTEQTTIASFLDKATEKIDKTIKLIEKKIELLEEYKKSLIHHVVTGKVDVREVEA